MKILLLSDLHGNLSALEKISDEISRADIVLFAGDFARFGAPQTGLPSLAALRSARPDALAVIGNCDPPEFLERLRESGMSAQGALVERNGLRFAGSGGGSKFTGATPNERSEEELLSDFEPAVRDDSGDWRDLILISHNPPKDTKCDSVNESVHAGSLSLRELIESRGPVAVLTGHIHEGAGVDKIGRTVVVNPGALLDGKFARMELSRGTDGWSVSDVSLASVD